MYPDHIGTVRTGFLDGGEMGFGVRVILVKSLISAPWQKSPILEKLPAKNKLW
jgi:hypothetical protein